MRRVWKFNNLNLRWKMLFSALIIPMSISILVSFFTYNFIIKNLTKNAMDPYQNTLDDIVQSAELRMNEYAQFIYEFTTDREINSFLTTMFTSDMVQLETYNRTVKRYVDLKASLFEYPPDFKVYHNNRSITITRFFTVYPSLTGVDDVDSLLADTSQGIKVYGFLDSPSGRQLVLYTPIKDIKSPYKNIGVFLQYISQNELRDLLTNGGEVTDRVLLLDPEGNILFSSGQAEDLVLPEPGGSIVIGAARYQFISQEISSVYGVLNGYKVGYLVPLSMVGVTRQTVVLIAVGFCLLTALLSILLSQLFLGNLRRRVEVLVSHMDSLSHGDVLSRIDSTDEDEIGGLYRCFNQTAEQLQTLLEENYLTQIRLQEEEISHQKSVNEYREMKYIALSSQINPHYLFNTLESIRMRLLVKGDEEVAAVVKAFADGYRYILDVGSDLVTLREELDLVRSFFFIEEFRFGKRVSLNVSVNPDSLLETEILSFSIQPFVENSCRHGLSDMKYGGEIRIDIAERERMLEIKVSDNGAGMEQEKLERLMENLQSDMDTRKDLALRSIYARYKLRYGDRFTFRMQSSQNSGTEVTLRFPLNGETNDTGSDCGR